MEGRPLSRDVIARHRSARLFSLGDRGNPASWAPALVISEKDPELPISMAPLHFKRDNSEFPAILTMTTREKICFPFDGIDEWSATEGLVLPPSLDKSDSGSFGTGVNMLPVSWQSLHHDNALSDDSLEPSIVILTDSPQLARSRGKLAKSLDVIRRRFPSSLIWAPGISGPDNCHLLSWLGVDLFDLSRSRNASASGLILSESGPREPEETLGEGHGMETQIKHWKSSLSNLRQSIRSGTLREAVENSIGSSPRSVERLRIHDSMMSDNIGAAGLSSVVGRGRRLRCNSPISRDDPLIRDWRARVSEFHTPPTHQEEVLLLLPCSATKPYRLSPSHHRFLKNISSNRIHQVMVTAPLGLVPRELEDFWPAAHYDIPVTGDWDEDELKIIRNMVGDLVERVGYKDVINHSGLEIKIDGANVHDTRMGDTAGSEQSLSRLELTTKNLASSLGLDDLRQSDERLRVMESRSRFIHGSDEWLKGAVVSGRPPILTITKLGEQLARWNPRDGRFALSKKALPLLESNDSMPRAHLISDHKWVGDLFPTNVDNFQGEIRVGDEMLVYQDGNLVGSARAVAPQWEWPLGPGRLARTRHRL
jgi:archaeosine synthase|tara:strand:+ start:18849 stop:20630 length:1782 start_codon:yes stop_codon:yes gene_type:complete